ncbi:MAG: hypothetical protein IKO73_09860 [Bacteroidaceae bacterium]|nr:hypothetical protein [Bacteroidaceae bacterium]
MSLERKRYIASWILLVVFLPTLLLSSLHIHYESETYEESCTECVHHQCHGHLSQLSDSMHHCVLCQFLTLTFVAGAVGAVIYFSFVCATLHAQPLACYIKGSCGNIVTRGPPVFRG